VAAVEAASATATAASTAVAVWHGRCPRWGPATGPAVAAPCHDEGAGKGRARHNPSAGGWEFTRHLNCLSCFSFASICPHLPSICRSAKIPLRQETLEGTRSCLTSCSFSGNRGATAQGRLMTTRKRGGHHGRVQSPCRVFSAVAIQSEPRCNVFLRLYKKVALCCHSSRCFCALKGKSALLRRMEAPQVQLVYGTPRTFDPASQKIHGCLRHASRPA